MAAVPMYDPLNGGQADAGSLEFFEAVETLERAEELIGVSHVETGAVVADEIDALTLFVMSADRDLGVGLFGGEFPGIAEQICQGDAEQVGVRRRDKIGLDLHMDAALPLASQGRVQHRARHFGDVH